MCLSPFKCSLMVLFMANRHMLSSYVLNSIIADFFHRLVKIFSRLDAFQSCRSAIIFHVVFVYSYAFAVPIGKILAVCQYATGISLLIIDVATPFACPFVYPFGVIWQQCASIPGFVQSAWSDAFDSGFLVSLRILRQWAQYAESIAYSSFSRL